MKRTVSIPIQFNPADFLPLLEECFVIFNSHVDWALKNKTYNKSKAHSALADWNAAINIRDSYTSLFYAKSI